MTTEEFECFDEKLEFLMQPSLHIPVNTVEVGQLQTLILSFMTECCIPQVHYAQNTNPSNLVLLSKSQDCDSIMTMLSTFSVPVLGNWTVYTSVILTTSPTIDVGFGTTYSILTADCDDNCSDDCDKSCTSSDDCGDVCDPKRDNKSCGFFGDNGYARCGDGCNCCSRRDDCCERSKYVARDITKGWFDTCCSNTGDDCRPYCEYQDPCYHEPRISLNHGGYVEDLCCDEDLCSDMKPFLDLPFVRPFRITKYNNRPSYYIKASNFKYVDLNMKQFFTPTEKGRYYVASIDSLRQYTGLNSDNPALKYVKVLNIFYEINGSDDSTFQAKMRVNEETNIKNFSYSTRRNGDHITYSGFLRDLLEH